MRLGHGQRRTVIILWLWTALLCGFVLFPVFEASISAYIPFGVAFLLIVLLTWFSPWLNRSHGKHDANDSSEQSVKN
jgi:hypothetical protein